MVSQRTLLYWGEGGTVTGKRGRRFAQSLMGIFLIPVR